MRKIVELVTLVNAFHLIEQEVQIKDGEDNIASYYVEDDSFIINMKIEVQGEDTHRYIKVNNEEYENVYNDIISRIEYILDMFENIADEVFEFNLLQYNQCGCEPHEAVTLMNAVYVLNAFKNK